MEELKQKTVNEQANLAVQICRLTKELEQLQSRMIEVNTILNTILYIDKPSED